MSETEAYLRWNDFSRHQDECWRCHEDCPHGLCSLGRLLYGDWMDAEHDLARGA